MKKLTALLITILTGVSLSADTVSVGGRLETFGAVNFHDRDNANDGFGEFRAITSFDFASTENSSVYLEAEARIDSEDYASGMIDDFAEDDERWLLNLREAYISYRFEQSSVQIGKQIFDWSVTDIISPSDNINPRDFTDLAEWERIGVPAVSVQIGYETFLELVYVPVFTPSKMPQGNWERELPVGLSYGDLDMPNHGVGQFAVCFGTVVGSWDLGASWYHGYSFNPAVDSFAPPNINYRYNREDVFAVSAVGEIGFGLMMRAELGYFDQDDDDDFVQCVVGVDRVSNDLLRPTDQLYWLVQYVGEIETNDVLPDDFRYSDFRRGFNNSVITRVEYTFNDREVWKLACDASYNFSDRDSYVQPSVTWQGDNVEVEVGFNIASGPSDSFWGGWDDSDRVYLKATRYF